jgi:4'-phosphopantetheinyl transferase
MSSFPEAKEPAWEIPPQNLRLIAGEVHVWGVDRSLERRNWAEATEFLSPEEIQRAERLLREESRYRFALSRKDLRRLLGLYLKTSPERISLVSLPRGRLGLSSNPKQDPLQFNLSHSGDWTLFAFRRNGRIGIDVALLEACRESDKPELFWMLWTLKEAKLKSLGMGIAGPHSFSGEWQLHSFSLAENAYMAGLALDPPASQLRFFRIVPSGLAAAR